MSKRRCRDRAQLKLEFNNPIPQSPIGKDVKGLVEALADLLMAAIGQPLPETRTVKGGVDEQDHA
ncbi:hypothetical protein GCM10007874_40420 [Labrys miyagiensis]|uniref:Uncharacterized protein n=1 Tax=Labrys miyagiensis TaxID=346912 RepID=A0ABQ6CQ55_9HYPH|nr:hypothetical protein GCM10007874_40420 [Labrys miyagiensis]